MSIARTQAQDTYQDKIKVGIYGDLYIDFAELDI